MRERVDQYQIIRRECFYWYHSTSPGCRLNINIILAGGSKRPNGIVLNMFLPAPSILCGIYMNIAYGIVGVKVLKSTWKCTLPRFVENA